MSPCDRCDGGRWWDWDDDTGWRSWSLFDLFGGDVA